MTKEKLAYTLGFMGTMMLIAAVWIMTQRINRLTEETASITKELQKRDAKFREFQRIQESHRQDILFLLQGCPDGVDGGPQ